MPYGTGSSISGDGITKVAGWSHCSPVFREEIGRDMFMVVGKKWLIGLLVAAVFAGLLIRYLDRVPKRHYCDFRVYHHAAQDILAGKDIYFRETMEITPFKYSPFFAFLFVPLGMLPIKLAAAAFFSLNVLLTAGLFRLAVDITRVGKDLSPGGGKKMDLLYGLSVFFLARYVILVWDSGQVSILMCVLVLAGLYFLDRRRDMAAGALLAAAILIKYTPAIFLSYFLVRRQFKVVAWTIVFAILWLVLPALAVGVQKEIGYISSWIPSIVQTSLDQASYLDAKNQSLFSMVLRFFTESGSNINITGLSFRQGEMVGYGLAAVLLSLVLVPPPGKPRDQSIDYALLFCFLPLFNPNGWLNNFVSLAVPCVLLLGRLLAERGKDRFVAACVLAAFFFLSLMSEEIVGDHWQNHAELFSDVTWGTLFLVAALIKLKFCTPALVKAGPVSEAYPCRSSA